MRVDLALVWSKKTNAMSAARMGQYPEVVQQLHSAAIDQGLSTYTLVYGLADGGNGLREALEAKFTNFQFILDHSHLKHYIETVFSGITAVFP